jgi:hypothetical protein
MGGVTEGTIGTVIDSSERILLISGGVITTKSKF